MPPIAVSSEELSLWEEGKAQRLDPIELWDCLRELLGKIGSQNMSTRALHYLATAPEEIEILWALITAPRSPTKKDCITCLAKCHKGIDDSSDCEMFFGTESGLVFNLETVSFASRWRYKMEDGVMHMAVLGKFSDVKGYKLVVACRNQKIFFVKPGGALASSSTIFLDSPCVTFCCGLRTVIVAAVNMGIQVYSSHGRLLCGTDVSAPVTAMTVRALLMFSSEMHACLFLRRPYIHVHTFFHRFQCMVNALWIQDIAMW